MPNNKHILIIPSWYSINEQETIGSFFREQAIALHTHGYKVGLIAPIIRSLTDLRSLFKKPLGYKKQIDHGVICYRWIGFNYLPRNEKAYIKTWIGHGLTLLKKYISENGLPDLIHAHSTSLAGALALEIYKKYGIPYVITEHSTNYARENFTQKDICKQSEAISNAKALVAVSQEFCSLLSTFFPNANWTYIPNIVDDSFLNATGQELNHHFTFINICYLTQKKRVDILIRAFAKITHKLPTAILNIGGEGAERSNLEQLVSELNLTNKVNFLGSLSRQQVLDEVSRAHAFVLSSDIETFGVVLIEALALGKPIISTKSGGPESIIRDNVGYLIEKRDINELANTMVKLYNEYTRFSSQEIKQYCQDSFGREAVISQLSIIYQNALTNE